VDEEEKTIGLFSGVEDIQVKSQAKVMTGGDPFPGGGEFEWTINRGLADDGRVFFTNLVLEGRAATGIYSILNGKISTIASIDDDSPAGAKFELIFGNSLTNNKAGVAVFSGLLDNGTVGLFMAIPKK
jgi:hypothetical protein